MLLSIRKFYIQVLQKTCERYIHYAPLPARGVPGVGFGGAKRGQKECFFVPQVVDSQVVVISLIMRPAFGVVTVAVLVAA